MAAKTLCGGLGIKKRAHRAVGGLLGGRFSAVVGEIVDYRAEATFQDEGGRGKTRGRRGLHVCRGCLVQRANGGPRCWRHIMNKLSEIIAAVMAALGRLVSKSVSVTKMIGGKLVRSTEVVLERVFDVAAAVPSAAFDITAATSKLALGAASDLVKMPFRLAGMVFGGRRGQQPSAQSAAAEEAAAQREAAAQEEARQAAADRQSEARELVAAVRSVAAARARGERLDDVALSRLPEPVRDYLLALDKDECGTVAAASVMGLRGVLRGKPPEGVRTPSELKEATGAEVVSAEQVAARRAEVKAAVRAAMRGEKAPSADVEDPEAIVRSVMRA